MDLREKMLREKFAVVPPLMNERRRRIVAAVGARGYGYDGTVEVSREVLIGYAALSGREACRRGRDGTGDSAVRGPRVELARGSPCGTHAARSAD